MGVVFLLAVSSWPPDARAAEVRDLYRAEAPVQSQEPAAREQAFRAALEAVLIKVTGSRDIAGQPAAEPLLASASNYVQQFGYRNRGAGTALDVVFDSAAVDAALTDANLPVWVDERPAVLAWLAVQSGDKRYLVDDDRRKKATRIVLRTAARRGIPVLFPLLDMEDRARVNVADVLGGFDENVIQASARYEADAVVITRVTQSGENNWRADWQLRYGGEASGRSFGGASMAAVLTDGVHFVADTLAQRLAVIATASASGGLVISVEGVDSLEDYARLRTYLDNLALVKGYRIDSVEPGYASFRLQVSGDPADVERLIALGNVLEEAPPPQRAPSAPNRAVVATGQELPALHFRMRQ